MNERIQQLAIKAYEACDKRTYGTIHSQEEFNQKFAELIVGECLELVEDEDDGSQDTLAVRWAMHRIRKHFGVKE